MGFGPCVLPTAQPALHKKYCSSIYQPNYTPCEKLAFVTGHDFQSCREAVPAVQPAKKTNTPGDPTPGSPHSKKQTPPSIERQSSFNPCPVRKYRHPRPVLGNQVPSHCLSPRRRNLQGIGSAPLKMTPTPIAFPLRVLCGERPPAHQTLKSSFWIP